MSKDYIYTHTTEYYSNIKEWNFAIRSNIDGLGSHCAKWNKSEKDKYHVCYHINVKSKKYNKLVNITKRSRLICRKPTSGYQWGGRETIQR